jgi:hypothetical protein
MNKLNPEHLHLLLDEPIYVLNEHFEGHDSAPVPEYEQLTNYKGENKKGILIIIEEKAEDTVAVKDEEFLFKGLNALNIIAEDVAIIDKHPDIDSQEIKHNKRITFSANPAKEKLYQVDTIDNISQLECHSINQIRNNQDLKVSFWLALKTMFEV